jgi:hypothetical protein
VKKKGLGSAAMDSARSKRVKATLGYKVFKAKSSRNAGFRSRVFKGIHESAESAEDKNIVGDVNGLRAIDCAIQGLR